MSDILSRIDLRFDILLRNPHLELRIAIEPFHNNLPSMQEYLPIQENINLLLILVKPIRNLKGESHRYFQIPQHVSPSRIFFWLADRED